MYRGANCLSGLPYYAGPTCKHTAESLIIVLLPFAFLLFCLPAQAKYGGGSGTADDPYQIWTAEQMNAIGTEPNDWDKHFKLMVDIDLGGYTGTSFNRIMAFSGVFDGNGRVLYNCRGSGALFGRVAGVNVQVKNLSLVKSDGYRVWNGGLLIDELEEATVSNCYVQDCNLSCKWPGDGVSGLVFSNNGTIIDCHIIRGRIEGGHNVGGGLAGYNLAGGTIVSCISSASINGHHAAGGLVGSNEGGISFCYSTGPVSGLQAGGLVGDNTGIVSNCYSTGDVQRDGAGGLVGWNGGIISNCYSAGSVSGTPGTPERRAGGLVGSGWLQGVTASFWDTQTSGQAASPGGTGKTTGEMKTAGTFLEAGWDFVGETENGTDDIWTICEALDYPRLAWQFVVGDYNGDGHTDLMDFCILAGRWLGTDSSFWWCRGADLTNDGFVDCADLAEFAESWLARK